MEYFMSYPTSSSSSSSSFLISYVILIAISRRFPKLRSEKNS